MLRRLAPVGVAWCVWTALVAGQQAPPPPQTPPQQPAPAFKSSVELVRLDVSVLDSLRLPVKGLKMGDFTVLENGKPQKIAAFTEVEVPDPVIPTTDWMRDVAMDIRRNDNLNDKRLILIVMDDAMVSSTQLHSIASVKRAAHAIVDQMGPGDLAAVVYTADSRNQQEFTSDRAKLLAVIDKFSGGLGSGPMMELFERGSVGTLLRACEVLAEIPQRRKAMFYISTGVALDLGALASPTYAGPGGTGGDPTGRAAWLKDQMNEVFRQAQIANVNIHAIDPSSLDGLAGAGGVFDPRKDFLFSVSENTGGFPIINRSDYADAIAQVFLENSSYYILGYEPSIPDDGKFRRLEIKTNQPGVTIRARSGYYAPEGVKSIKSSKGAKAGPSPLWKAIGGLLPVGDLPMQVVAAPFAFAPKPGVKPSTGGNKSEATVAVALGLVQDIETGDERHVQDVEFLIDALGQDGNSKSVHGLKAAVTFKPNVKGKVGYEVLTRIDLKPGHYQIRLSAHLPSQNLSGSVYYDVDVPDFSKGPLGMSGAMLSVTPSLIAAPRDLLSTLMPIVPTTNRYFYRGTEQVSAFVALYQPKGGLKPVELTTRITDSQGTEVITSPTTLAPLVFGGDRRSAGYRYTIPLDRLQPGHYLLTFEAKLEKTTIRRDVRFVVVK